jgi:hypothetical protein
MLHTWANTKCMKTSVAQAYGNEPCTKAGTQHHSGAKSTPPLFREAHDSRCKLGLASLTFSVFSCSWWNDVFNYATSAAFQILSTSLTPPPFDATSTRNVVKRDKRSRENCILYRRCHSRIYFNINSVQVN